MSYRARMKLFASLRSRALLVILLATLPLLIGVVDGYRRERAAAITDIEVGIRTLLQVTIRQDSEVVKDIGLMLRIMSNANDMKVPTTASCSGLAQRLMMSQPDFANIGAAWPNGDVFCSAREMTQAVNVSDRPWFQEVVASRDLSAGHYQVGRVSGEHALTYGFPQIDAAGNLHTALFVAVKLDWFGRLLQYSQLPATWHALIVTQDGIVAASYPTELHATHMPQHDMWRFLGDPPSEPVVRLWHEGEVEHLHGIAPLPSTRGALYLIIGTDTQLAMAPLERRFRYQIALAIGFALASSLLAWFAIRGSVLDWVKHMNAVVFSFGSGNLDTRAGVISSVAELQLLADNFDAMAEHIETLNNELEARVAARTAALTRSNAELEAFAYSVSHDLRAPLRAVSGFSEILNESHGTQLDAEGRRYLDNVKRAADHMNHLIDDLLQFSRVGHSAVKNETVALAPMLHNMTMLFQSRLAPGGRIEIAAPLASPSGDPRLLKQILANLIDNAIKYQPAGQAPIIKISAVPTDDHVAIRVADNGIGIAPEYQEMIFKVFQRLHDEDAYPGTGIGLAIAQKAALLMNGSLTIESAPGQGSVFTLRLPAARQVSE
jgi:signal transduction histidine kinase